MLQTLAKIQQLLQVAPQHLLSHLLSQFQEQAKTIQTAEEHQNILGRVSTSVLRFLLLHRYVVEGTAWSETYVYDLHFCFMFIL